jgi:chromosome segregation ATPase
MANPRELAEQAFALLQNAISESEARASDLDEQLKRKRTPKNRLEDQLDVLSHRLESVDAERTRWEQQAGHLEEVAEAERVKVAQLKRKLEIAESGPEKLTKKEVNFWRAKAEQIDAQIKDYQERLTTLRRELNERDALIEKLKAAGGVPDTGAPESQDETDNELRRQLEQRDSWLAELRLELHELRAQPVAPLETEAQVETLRSHVASLERALAEAHNTRAAVQADLARAEQTAAERERAIREAATDGDRARATLAEREHRIVELSAEVEHLRNELRQHENLAHTDSARQNEQLASLTRDAEALRSRLEQDRHDTSAARTALELALQEREHEIARQRQLLQANESDFAELRRQVEERELAAAEARRQVEERSAEIEERDRELAERQQALRDLGQTLTERDEQHSASAGEIEQLRTTLATHAQEIESLRSTLHDANRELERARATLTANERELTSLRDTLGASSRDLDELRAQKQRLETALAEVEADTAGVRSEIEAAREQIAGLEGELKEEREHAESLGELANERREHMTKLQEQVEEAEERFADANWRLGKSLHFERIVKRRRGLIEKLLAALRAKMKANTALKAGLDGLRTFKATAEMNQHKLLQRIDSLKAELKEAEETVKRHQGGTAAKEEITSAVSRAAALEERLNTQAELIQSLEADLKTARLSHKAGDDRHHELERLTKELETKNQVIAQLQADADDQQRKLSKLRGSESETVRLKALTEKDRGEIDALQQEVTQLREAVARQSGVTPASGNNAELEAKLKDRENSVTRLMGTIKEHETAIKKLTESAESWKRTYQFLATDDPGAYKNTAEK